MDGLLAEGDFDHFAATVGEGGDGSDDDARVSRLRLIQQFEHCTLIFKHTAVNNGNTAHSSCSFYRYSSNCRCSTILPLQLPYLILRTRIYEVPNTVFVLLVHSRQQ